MPNAIELGELMTIPMAAKLVGYSKETLYRAMRQGHLRYYKPRGAKKGYRVTRECLDEWIRGDWELFDLVEPTK